jgi:hypothetical protein
MTDVLLGQMVAIRHCKLSLLSGYDVYFLPSEVPRMAETS